MLRTGSPRGCIHPSKRRDTAISFPLPEMSSVGWETHKCWTAPASVVP